MLGPDCYPGDISVLEPGRAPADLDDGLLLDVMADCVGPRDMFDTFASSAAALQAWIDGGCAGNGRPGGCGPYVSCTSRPLTRAWASSLYRAVHDPDGRPRPLRRRHAF